MGFLRTGRDEKIHDFQQIITRCISKTGKNGSVVGWKIDRKSQVRRKDSIVDDLGRL